MPTRPNGNHNDDKKITIFLQKIRSAPKFHLHLAWYPFIFSSTHHVIGVEVFHGADVFTREGTRSGHFLIIPGFGTSFGGNVGHGEGDNARLEHEGNHFEIVCRGCFAFGEERLKPMRNVSELNDN